VQIKTKGMVLSHRNIGENDRILTVLTEELGLVEMAARRVKSPRSPLSAATQLLTYSEFCLFKGKQSYYIIDSAETIEPFYKLRLDVRKLALAGYFCELAASLSPAAENAVDSLRLLLNSIHLLQEEKLPEEQIKAIFELRALSLGGFLPNLIGCDECGEFEREQMIFLPLDGILLCADCLAQSPRRREGMISFAAPAPVLAAMRHIVYSETDRMFAFKIAGESLEQLARITEHYVLLHTEAKSKSLEVYRSLK